MILDSFELNGKVAIVTGCNTGLGQGMALGLAQAGCDIVGINQSAPEETEQKIIATGRRFLDLRADLSSIIEIPKLIEKAVSEFSHIDILAKSGVTTGHDGDFAV